MAKDLGFPLKPYPEWLALLAESGRGLDADSEVAAMRQNPALKILDFFQEVARSPTSNPEAMGIPPLDVSKAQKVAPSLGPQKLPQLCGEDVSTWVAYWRKSGFL